VGFFKYLKAAFLNHWNLLIFGGGLAFGALSGQADVAVPLVLAGEAAYLGFLGTHPKFQKYVEAQEAKVSRQQGSQTAEDTVRRILASLPDRTVRRFEDLRSRCLELRQLAGELRDPNRVGVPQPFEDMQLAGLDKLLWIFLQLLFTQHSLERFLAKTNEAQIKGDIARIEDRLKGIPQDDDPQRQKMRKALEDNLQTSKTRLENYQKAHDNHQLIQLEIDRLENKIRTISELAVNRQDAGFISGQVDQVASSMVQTERTMNELQFLTGLERTDEAVPPMLQRETIRVR